MLKETNYYYGNISLTKGLVLYIADAVFGKDNTDVSLKGHNLDEFKAEEDVKGIEFILKPKNPEKNLPEMIGFRKKTDFELSYNPDYVVKITGEDSVVDEIDKQIKTMLGLD